MLKIIVNNVDKFFNVAFQCATTQSHYVSPMKMDLKRFLSTKNPLFRSSECFKVLVCEKNGRLAGRLLVHEHEESNKLYNEKKAYFGFFECIDDLDVARCLFSEAESWAMARGLTSLQGNFNLTAMQQIGVMVEGFDKKPYMDQTYSPPHHAALLVALGYQPIFPMATFELNLNSFDPQKLLGPKQMEMLSRGDLEFTTLKKTDFNKAIDATRLVLNDGFENNPMFVPLSAAEMMFQAKDMIYIIDESISCLVYDRQGPQGVIVCLPDINPFLSETKSQLGFKTPFLFLKHRRKRDRAVIIFYSVCKRMHNQGLNGAMLFKVLTALKERGYKTLGLTWAADINGPSLRQIERLGAERMHRLNIYQKSLVV